MEYVTYEKLMFYKKGSNQQKMFKFESQYQISRRKKSHSKQLLSAMSFIRNQFVSAKYGGPS